MADGINTGGQSRTPICQLPNVEHTEQSFPVLFLYRKELPDSGGAGRYRGGLSAESCFIPHNTDVITQDTLSSGNATPTSSGMMGGYPSTTNAYSFVRDSDIAERFAERAMPEDISELGGNAVTLQLPEENFEQGAHDVYAVRWTGGGGFGDPLDRSVDDLQDDLANYAITIDTAIELFGAVVDDSGNIVADATASRRAELRAPKSPSPSGSRDRPSRRSGV